MARAESSNAYALPTRLIWLMLAEVYFFPVYYKVVGGTDSHLLEWAFSDSLQNKLAMQWYIQVMDPPLRLDAYPLACRLLSLMVIVWEFCWPLALFSRRLRVPLALSTIFFHYSTSLVMGFVFIHLRWLMLTLFPWPGIFSCLGRLCSRNVAIVQYSPHSPRQLYLVNVLKSFDLWQRLEFRPVESQATAMVKESGLPVVSVDGNVLDPRAGQRAIRRRLGWPISFRWLKLAARHLPSNCDAGNRAPDMPADRSSHRLTQWLAGVATAILFINFLMAVGHIHRAWPFAVFPTFETLSLDALVHELQIELVDHNGQMVRFERTKATQALYATVWYEITMHAMQETSPIAQQNRLRAIWSLLRQKSLVDEAGISEVRFYDTTLDTVPERIHTPVKRKLIFEMPIRT